MKTSKELNVETPIGSRAIDSAGSPVGIVHMDPNQSYSGIGELLQNYLSSSNPDVWNKIKKKIDFTAEKLDYALSALESEAGFGAKIKLRIAKGQKLLFKPNLVNPLCIDPNTFAPSAGSTTCTEWPFIAALMRWFHDKLEISYYQMCIGEAATCLPMASRLLTQYNPDKKMITTEAVIEGKSGRFYGGWGFYFVRKYLAEYLKSGSVENPMNGYEESIQGVYLPPGQVTDKLMVYDLNRIFDDPSKGRSIKVPDGVNFNSIMLHKVIVGGFEDDLGDRRAYPGSVVVNVPKFKVHMMSLFTNVIKNLGIGLYPMQYASKEGGRWDYSIPHHAIPGIKGMLPHNVWNCKIDEKTCLPSTDETGLVAVSKTGGITATMIDIIKAVQSQDIFMMHVVDGIEAINLDHAGLLPGVREPEGMVFAGMDPVACDLLCARYMFSNVPLKDASQQTLEDGNGGHFPQSVPVPVIEGKSIVTHMGFDCPLARDLLFKNAEQRGLGLRSYYAVGMDSVANSPIVTIDGHLGTVSGHTFTDLITSKIYFGAMKMPWDMQKTAFSYFSAVDAMSGSSLKQEFLNAFDEDGDGIITYEEFGKKGLIPFLLYTTGNTTSMISAGLQGALKGMFLAYSLHMKFGELHWNNAGCDLMKEFSFGSICYAAYFMSKMDVEMPDLFTPGLVWGRGKWPSFNLARYIYLGVSIYGDQFPYKIMLKSLYGCAFRYADLTQNAGKYTGIKFVESKTDAIGMYLSEYANSTQNRLDFKLYLPTGYESLAGAVVPHVEITDDPSKIFTASFKGGEEIWESYDHN